MDNYISCFWSSWWTLKYLQASENTIMSAVKNRSGETFSHVFMGFLQVLQFPSTVKNHAGWGSLFTPQKVWMWVWIIFRPQNLLLGGPSPKGQINSNRLTSKKPPDLLQRTGRITGHTSRALSVYSEWEQFVGLWWVLLGQFRHVLLFYCTVVRVIGVKTGLGHSEDWQHKGQGCVPGFLK